MTPKPSRRDPCRAPVRTMGMELEDARVLIAGATGELGSALARRLTEENCKLGLLGRDPERLEALADELGAVSARFDAGDRRGIPPAVDAVAAGLGGLDSAVVASGVAAFGRADELEHDELEQTFAVNALAPIALLSAALRHLPEDGAVVGVTAIVADHPTAGIASYSAAKAAFSAYLAVLRRERRRHRARRAAAAHGHRLHRPRAHGRAAAAARAGGP